MIGRTPWFLAAKDDRTGGPKYGYAVNRGALAQLDRHSALLWAAVRDDLETTADQYAQLGEATNLGLVRSYLESALGEPDPAVPALAYSPRVTCAAGGVGS
jgi:hypothetical protein